MALGRAGKDWAQYRKPIVVETRVGKERLVVLLVGFCWLFGTRELSNKNW